MVREDELPGKRRKQDCAEGEVKLQSGWKTSDNPAGDLEHILSIRVVPFQARVVQPFHIDLVWSLDALGRMWWCSSLQLRQTLKEPIAIGYLLTTFLTAGQQVLLWRGILAVHLFLPKLMITDDIWMGLHSWWHILIGTTSCPRNPDLIMVCCSQFYCCSKYLTSLPMKEV